MISIINKAFYACSTEPLFLSYKKTSKKAVKIGGFPQCSAHVMAASEKLIKNFVKPYHEELSSKAWSM